MPVADHICSSCDGVATSESGEGMGSGVGLVLEEDSMLGLSSEMLHVGAEGEGGEVGVRE